jgi:hypothetical protein
MYHGAEPSSQIPSQPTRKDARSRLSLPEQRRIALVLGFGTATKGWDILEKINVPDDWFIIVNAPKNPYNSKEKVDLRFRNDRVIDIRKDLLEEEELF